MHLLNIERSSIEFRRVARIWKRGGLFWKSEKSANDLHPNFHCSWISFTRFVRKLRQNLSESSEIQSFFRPKSGGLQKKKVLIGIGTDFSAEIGNSNVFSAQNQVVSKKKKKKKKKGLHRNWDWFFGRNRKFERFFRPKSGGLQNKKGLHRNWDWFFLPNPEIQTFEGGLFSIFHKKSASKPPKTCDFAYFTSQWGGSSPPPWLRYWLS